MKFDDFVKINDDIVMKKNIVKIDCSELESLVVKAHLINGDIVIAKDIHALELVMQTKPSMFEGKRLKWPKFVWFIHNIFGHPLTQIFSLFRMYQIAFWIHDITVPKPIGKKK